jgi:PBP4 family serine-type D-alanyl-D-alanine carboxypeptidase
MKIQRSYILLFLALNFSFANAQELQERIQQILNSTRTNPSEYGIAIFSTRTNKFLFENNSESLLIPASTAKLYTTSTALLFLGDEYNVKTEISTDDMNINDHIIDGNIFFKGYGDPTFSILNLEEMVKTIKSRGIKSIKGDIIVDDSFFDEILFREEWIEDENRNIPLPAICAATIDRNTLTLSIRGNSRIGRKPSVSITPNIDYFTVVNSARTSGRRVRISTTANLTKDGEKISVTGTIPRNRTATIKVLIKNPPLFIGNLLNIILSKNGIEFKGKILTQSSPEVLNLLSSHGTPLVNLIFEINKRSDNFIAEHLFKIIGANYSEGSGGAFDATQAIFTFLKSSDLYEEDLSIVDGSGISRNNKFSAKALVRLLTHIYYTKDEFNHFYNSLSIAGIDGTMEGRMHDTPAFNNCHAKTGTLRGVNATAGYVTSKDHDLIIFSMNFNSFRRSANYYRDVMDRVISLLAETDILKLK